MHACRGCPGTPCADGRTRQRDKNLHTGLPWRFRRANLIGGDTLILTSRGRKKGKEISTPLFYARDADRLLIAASFAGSGVPPGWYLNLVAHLDLQVTTSGRTKQYRARTLSDAEAEAAWPKLLAVYPTFARYRQRAQRTIPVIVSRRTVDDRLAGVHVMEESALPRAGSTTIANTSRCGVICECWCPPGVPLTTSSHGIRRVARGPKGRGAACVECCPTT